MKKKLESKKSISKKVVKAKPVKAVTQFIAKPKPKPKPKPKAKVEPKVKVTAKAKVAAKPIQKTKEKIQPKIKEKVTITKKIKVNPMTVAIPKAIQKETQGPYQEIKKMLERQKHALLADAGATLESTLNPASEGFPDWTDQASMEVDQNCVLRLREREQHLLNKIEDAIDRINGDTFGTCEVCNEPISLKRLKARPVTTLCIECKTKQEYEEKMRQ